MPAGYGEWVKMGVELGNSPLNGSGGGSRKRLLSRGMGSNFAHRWKNHRQFGKNSAHGRPTLTRQVYETTEAEIE